MMETVTEYVKLEWDWTAPLSEFHAYLDKMAQEIPEEFRAAVQVSLESSEYSVDFCLEYKRPETNDERSNRLRIDEDYEAQRKAGELRELTRLKKKYER